MTLSGGKKHRKSMAALHLRILKMVVYDNKNLHITELEGVKPLIHQTELGTYTKVVPFQEKSSFHFVVL
jgi:hypothetical protein